MSTNVSDTPEQRMTLERLKSLYELIARMNSVYELQDLLEFVVDRALSLTGGRRGLLLLSDDYERQLRHVAVVRGEGLDDQHVDQVLDYVSTTVIKDVLDQGEPRLVADLQLDQRFGEITSITTLTIKKVRSVLAVPLKVEDQLVGLIYVDHSQQAIFGQSELDFLSAFANQAALAIHRAQQHQRQIDELTLLNELSRSVVQVLNLDEVLTRIVYEAIRMLNVETGSVLLLDKEATELTFATSVSNGKRLKISTRLRPNQGIAGWVVANAEPACVNDVNQDPRWFGEVETGFVTYSLLCVPLQLNGRVLGVIQVLNKKSGGFDSGDIARLSAFAISATIAIENARLFQEAGQARQLSALNEVALTLSSTLNLATILETGLSQAITLLKADAGAIMLLNEYPELEPFPNQVGRGLAANTDLTEPQLQALRRLSGLSLELGNQALIVDEQHPAQDPVSIDLMATGLQALAIAPIKTGYEVQGGLAVIQTNIHTFTDEEISLLISLARIIGLAAQNAIHYNQMRTQTMHLTYLNEVGSALISSLDLDHVLKVIIQGVNALLETERTSVFLIDAQTNELVLRYTNEGNAEIRLPAPWQGIAGWVATHDQPALVNDTLGDPRHLRKVAIEASFEAHSILCVPLKVEGEVIGVVEVLNKADGQEFTIYHQIMLVEFVRWAAIAIHNAWLFDEKVQAFERLAAEQQRRIAAETRGAMAAVILDMAHTMNNVVGAIRVWASNLENQTLAEPEKPLGEVTKEVSRIRQNAEEAIKLISNMTGPLEQAELDPTDVHQCLAAAIKSCWWPDNIVLKEDYGADIPLVKANAKRLETVFHNLLSNAVQALAQQGGQIRLQTRYIPTAGQVEISIADNGPGIPLDLQNHLFNPGVSGTDGGLGIGLWLVETFVHQFDGHINFTSSEREGTTFLVGLQSMQDPITI